MTAKGIVQTTGSKRVKFGKIRLSSEYPDLLEIQIKSFQEFFQLETTPENRINEGLYRVFQENFPITDARNIFVLEFLDYFCLLYTSLSSTYLVRFSNLPFGIRQTSLR